MIRRGVCLSEDVVENSFASHGVFPFPVNIADGLRCKNNKERCDNIYIMCFGGSYIPYAPKEAKPLRTGPVRLYHYTVQIRKPAVS